MDEIRRVKEKYTGWLLADPNVVAVGVGLKQVGGVYLSQRCVAVSVKQKTADPARVIPATLEGVPTDIIETGEIRALRTEYYRPASGGVSVGHVNVTAGTLGCLVERENEVFILSNNHVLADSNEGQPGDAILQPGAADGGTVAEDQIAELADFVPVEFLIGPGQCPVAGAVARAASGLAGRLGSAHRFGVVRLAGSANLVDAAIALPLAPSLVSAEILGIGWPAGTGEAILGQNVVKSGRTTEVTHGKVTQLHVTVQVMYGQGLAIFEDQIVAELACGGGDSGSVVLDGFNNVVGLLFGGTQDGKTAIFNRIQNVEAALRVSIHVG